MTQIVRFLRVFLSAAIPVVIAFAVSLPTVARLPLVAVTVAAIQVAWRQANPLEGTSQLARFVRVFIFGLLPQLFTLHPLLASAEWAAMLGTVTALAEVAYRETWPTSDPRLFNRKP
jgi:hypothetical protein